MNNEQPAHPSIPTAAAHAVGASQEVERDRPKRGLGSLQKKKEIFTRRKNAQGAKKVQEDKIQQLKLQYGTLSSSSSLNPYDEQMFKDILEQDDVNYDSLEVTISTSVIPPLATETLKYLSNQKVEVKPDDLKTLEQVTILQVRTKVMMARASSSKISFQGQDPILDITRKNLNKVIGSHELYLDQIGLADSGKQTIVPRLAIPPVPEVPEGYVRSDVTYKDKVLYVPGEFQENPFSCPVDLQRMIDERRYVNIDKLVMDYQDLIQRVAKKCQSAVRILDFKSKGTLAQMVGSRNIEFRGSAYRNVWCARDICPQLLVLGGGFQLGLDSSDVIHSPLIACPSLDLDLRSFLEKIQWRNRELKK